MARIFLDGAGSTYKIVNGAEMIFGSTDSESVVFFPSATGAVIDESVEQVSFGGSFADYKYVSSGSALKVYDGSGVHLLATIALGGDGDGAKVVFSDKSLSVSLLSSSTSTGSTTTGSTTTGSTNTGSTNTGSTNTGSTNTGSTNTGSTTTTDTPIDIAANKGSGKGIQEKYPFLTLAKFADAAYNNDGVLPADLDADWNLLKSYWGSVYKQENAAAIVAQSGDSLIISFRGTDFDEDSAFGKDRDAGDWVYQERHYKLFEELISSVKDYVLNQASGVTKVYVTGHSLGAVMATWYLSDADNGGSYLKTQGIDVFGASFAPPEILDWSLSDRRLADGIEYYRFENGKDLVPDIVQVIEHFIEKTVSKKAGDFSSSLYTSELKEYIKKSLHGLGTIAENGTFTVDNIVDRLWDKTFNNTFIESPIKDLFDIGTSLGRQINILTTDLSGYSGMITSRHSMSEYLASVELLDSMGIIDDLAYARYDKNIAGDYIVNNEQDVFDAIQLLIGAANSGVNILGDDSQDKTDMQNIVNAASWVPGVWGTTASFFDPYREFFAAEKYTENRLVVGSNFNDYLVGDTSNGMSEVILLDNLVSNDLFYIGRGNDTVYGDYNHALFDGVTHPFSGSGVDVVAYKFPDTIIANGNINSGGVSDDLDIDADFTARKVGLDGSTDTLWDVERLHFIDTASDKTNLLAGASGSDTINGLGGNDYLYGENGNDTISGGVGNDRIHGGADDDTAIFDGAVSNYNFTVNNFALEVINSSNGEKDVLYSVENIKIGSEEASASDIVWRGKSAFENGETLSRTAENTLLSMFAPIVAFSGGSENDVISVDGKFDSTNNRLYYSIKQDSRSALDTDSEWFYEVELGKDWLPKMFVGHQLSGVGSEVQVRNPFDSDVIHSGNHQVIFISDEMGEGNVWLTEYGGFSNMTRNRWDSYVKWLLPSDVSSNAIGVWGEGDSYAIVGGSDSVKNYTITSGVDKSKIFGDKTDLNSSDAYVVVPKSSSYKLSILPVGDMAMGFLFDDTKLAGLGHFDLAGYSSGADTVVKDVTAPKFIAASPADDATSVSISSNIVLSFDEAIDGSLSDLTKVYLKEAVTGKTVSAQASITGSQNGDYSVTIDPTSNLANNTKYYVVWDEGAFKDSAGNAVVGVVDNNMLNFTTAEELKVTNLEIRLVSSNSSGIIGNAGSYVQSISSDGRYVAFVSYASNLVDGDINSAYDIFLKDTETGAIKPISSSSSRVIGNANSSDPSTSSDGRYVAFVSYASNLVDVDTNSAYDIFLKDTQTGIIKLISSNSNGVIGNNASVNQAISSDGRYVAFDSYASNLVDGDWNGSSDIFLKDTQTGDIKLISSNSSGVVGNGASNFPSISSSGKHVAFHSSSSNLVDGDTNTVFDIFLKDTQTGDIKLISSNSNGVIGNNASFNQAISSDGRYVAFDSYASNLVDGDWNGSSDIFLKDTQTGDIKLISSNSNGVIGNSTSNVPSISSDGRYVAFRSYASNLVGGDTNLIAGDANGYYDIFIKDTHTGAIKLISKNSNGVFGNKNSLDPSISSDGRYISFYSEASNLVDGDTNDNPDVFIVGNPLYSSFESTIAPDDLNTSATTPSPSLKGNLKTFGARDVYIDGNYAFIADSWEGLKIVDVSNLATPTLVSSLDTSEARGLAIQNGYAYIADGQSGLKAINVSDVLKPIVADSISTSDFAIDVSVDGNYAYVANYESGLTIIDISNPTDLKEKGKIDTSGRVDGITVNGSYAYLADGYSGLKIIDISNPSNPKLKGSIDTLGYADDVAVSGNYAYIADSWEGLQIIDISNPSNPVLKGRYDTDGYALGVTVSGNYAYVADESYGLQIIDISNPDSPTAIGKGYDTPGYANSVQLVGNYAYIADGTYGLQIVGLG